MIVSTGGATLEDIERAYETIAPINPQLAFLQCTAGLPGGGRGPQPPGHHHLRERFPELVVGLSDHENGIAMAVAAYVLGARIVEKHFTLNHTDKGTDHAFSLEPIGMRKLVRDLRRTRVALGDGVKHPVASERQPLLKMGKKLVAAPPALRGARAPRGRHRHEVARRRSLAGAPAERCVGRTVLLPLEPDDEITFEVLGQGEAD